IANDVPQRVRPSYDSGWNIECTYGNQLDRRVNLPHRSGKDIVGPSVLAASGATKRRQIFFVANRPQLDLERFRMSGLSSQAAHLRIRSAVAILDPLSGLFWSAGSDVDRDEGFSSQGAAERDEIIRSDIVRGVSVPRSTETSGSLVYGTDAILPVVVRNEPPPRPAN